MKKNKELSGLYHRGLEAALFNEDLNFSVWVTKNMKIIEKENDLLLYEEKAKPSKEYSQKEQEIQNILLDKYGKKDSKGALIKTINPKTGNFIYDIINIEAFGKEYDLFWEKEENKQIKETQIKKESDYEKWLNDDIETNILDKLVKRHKKLFPSKIKGEIIYFLYPLIEGLEDEEVCTEEK